MALTSKLGVQIVATHTSALDLATAETPVRVRRVIELANGNSADQADLIWHDRRTVAGSGSDSLDLAGSLTDAYGNMLTFARVKAIMITAALENTTNLVIGGANSNAWATWVGDASDVVIVRPGGVFFLAAPDATAYAVTADSGDVLRIANSGGTDAVYDIVLIGASSS